MKKRGLLIGVCSFLFLFSLIYSVYAAGPIIEYSSELEDVSMVSGESKVFYVLASDADSAILNYYWYVNNEYVGGGNTYEYLGGVSGGYSIKVDVSDGLNNASKIWSIVVLASEEYPEAEISEKEILYDWFWIVLIILFVILILFSILLLVIELRRIHNEKIIEKGRLEFST